MRTKRLVLAAALLVTTAGLAQAAEAPPGPPPFGMVGLARGQLAVLNAVLTRPPDALSCQLTLSFVDSRGDVLHDRSGAEIKRTILLRGNVANGLALRSSDILGTDEIRRPVRAVVSEPPEPNNCLDCRSLALTLEIVNSAGATTLFESAGMPPRDPPPPDPRCPPLGPE